MRRYKIIFESRRNGKLLSEFETEITCSRPPKIGEGKRLLTDPPIIQTITKVTSL